MDYSAAAPGATVAIVVGTGGESSATAATPGAVSSTTIGGLTSSATGGPAGISTSWCSAEGLGTITGNGNGNSAAVDQPAGDAGA